MGLTNLTSKDSQGGNSGQLLSGTVNVKFKVTELVRDVSNVGFDTNFTYNEYTDTRGYDLNDPYQYGAFIQDSINGFEEFIPARISAWTELLDPQTTDARKQQILDLGKPYPYDNTKRLAVVTRDGNVILIPDQDRIIIYEYDYASPCERLDFEQKVVPGTNAADPSSPCNQTVDEPTTEEPAPTIEIGLLENSFIDFDDYRAGFRTLFQEIGSRQSSTEEFQPFVPKRFEFVSQDRIVDEFEEIIGGPIRIAEETISLPRGVTQTDIIIYQRVQRKNLRTGEIRDSIREEEVYRRTIEQTPETTYVYKRLAASDIKNIRYNTTEGCWYGSGSLFTYFTSSLQSDVEKSYKLNVVENDCYGDTLFTIYYGDMDGYGTQKISDDRQKSGYSKSVYYMFNSLVGNSFDKQLFFTDNSTEQIQSLLDAINSLNGLAIDSFINNNFTYQDNRLPNPVGFNSLTDTLNVSGSSVLLQTANSSEPPVSLTPIRKASNFFAIQINPRLLKNSIDEGNFELNLAKLLSGSIEVDAASDKIISLIDSSRIYNIQLEGDTLDSYRYKTNYIQPFEYDIVSGSIQDGIYQNNNPVVYGKLYPGFGLLILDATKLDDELNLGLSNNIDTNGNNPLKLFTSISGAAQPTSIRDEVYPFILRQSSAVIVDKIQITLNDFEFNYSTNPSYYYSRNRSPFYRDNATAPFAGKLRPESLLHREWFYEPTSYITSIGLYNDNYELLAIGKLSRPVKKTVYNTLKFDVTLKY